MALPTQILILLALAGSMASASEVADGRGGVNTGSTAVRGQLRTSDAARLFKGEIPLVSHLDGRYGRRDPAICLSSWTRLRATRVEPRPIQANIETIHARAKALGLSFSKVDRALAVFLKNQNALPNQRYVSIIDFDKSSKSKRLFSIDLRSGRIDSFHVASGKGSDPFHTGTATQFGNIDKSKASSLGCYVGVGRYNGKFGRSSLALHGIEKTNDLACKRSIVIHPADYVKGGGRSDGCPAVDDADLSAVFDRVGGGGLICAYRDGLTGKAAARYTGGRGHRKARHARHRHHHRHSRRTHHDV